MAVISEESSIRSPFAEHRFVYNRSQFEIDKRFYGGDYTEYDFRVRDLRDSFNRFRVAFQWIKDDGTDYEGLLFELRIPRSESTTEEAVVNIWKCQSYLFNADKSTLNDYIRSCLSGEYIAWYNPDVSIITQKTSRIGFDDGSGLDTFIELRFRATGFEPIGENKFWYVYEWFDDEDICVEGETCLDYNRIEGRYNSYDYWTVS